MPYDILAPNVPGNHCSADKPWCVVLKSDHKTTFGCHPTRALAQRQIAAIYANEQSPARDRGADMTVTGDEIRVDDEGRDEDLDRDLPFEITGWEDRSDDKPAILEGYAAVFNSEAEITDWRGSYHEKFVPGAFKRTIGTMVRRDQSDARGIPFLFQHGKHPFFQDFPIGTIRSLTEDERGLKVIAEFFRNKLTKPIEDAIRAHEITGMSTRFRPIVEHWVNRDDGVLRVHEEVALRELGPVINPAYSDTALLLRSLSSQLEDFGVLSPAAVQLPDDTRDSLPRSADALARETTETTSEITAAFRAALVRRGSRYGLTR